MKLKIFIRALADIYNITLYDETDTEQLFSCKSDSKALLNYGDWEIVEIAITHSILGADGFAICIKEGSADNE